MKKILASFCAVFLLTSVGITIAEAHSGGLDKKGCHHDRKRGGYHCH
ncbi:MAG: YHYH domain-containing protein [Planctomycetota bacterium]